MKIDQAYRKLGSHLSFSVVISVLVIVVAPLIIYSDLIFGNYTASYNVAAAESLEGIIPAVHDPAAGSYQDHPWLHYIGASLKQGVIPFVNQDNGLGSFLLESMQSGVFYPLNILLVLMDLDSPQFFDYFIVVHVGILLWSAYTLAKLYVRWDIALILAIALAISPITFSSINMVHYRAFAWAPLMAWAAILAVRNCLSPGVIGLGAFALVACFTAGNPQESVLDLIATGAIAVVELGRVSCSSILAENQTYPNQSESVNLSQTAERPFSFKSTVLSLITLGLGFGGALLVAAIAILPYLACKASGLIQTVGVPERYLAYIDFPWLLNLIVPNINGSASLLFRKYADFDSGNLIAIHPLLWSCIVSGLVAIAVYFNRIKTSTKISFSLLLIVAILGIANISPLKPFNPLISQVDFLAAFRFGKYVYYIHLLVFVAATIAIMAIVELPRPLRHRLANHGIIAAFGTVVAAFVIEFIDLDWSLRVSDFTLFRPIWMSWAATLAMLIVTPLLLWRNGLSRYGFSLLIGCLLLTGFALKPPGFARSLDQHLPLLAADVDVATARFISSDDSANVNLLRHYERLGVFDPVLNNRFSSFILSHFYVLNPAFHIQIPGNTIITTLQVELLRLLGVTHTFAYQVEDSSSVTRLTDQIVQINQPLPRVFLLEKSSADSIHQTCLQGGDQTQIAGLIEAAIASRGTIQKEPNAFSFRLDAPGSGVLVALQAFTPAWKLNQTPATDFCNLFTAWSGEFDNTRRYHVSYHPIGLGKAIKLAMLGGLMIGASVILSAWLGNHV